MNHDSLSRFVEQVWDDEIVPTLVDYIRIPNKSPAFDPRWAEHGYMEQAVELVADWCRDHAPRGSVLDVIRLPGRTPLIFIDVPGDSERTVVLYGHLDKQPEMTGWREDLGPWIPVVEDDKLYGRGGADDGYAAFASLTALNALDHAGIPRARCVVIIEACEESGSYDLPYYIETLATRIGKPELVICLDSGCGNYDQLWCTTSLRGTCAGRLSVEILTEGVHSGDAGGVIPSTFRVLRKLLSRIEDQDSGQILPEQFHVTIPKQRKQQAAVAAQVLGEEVYSKFPFSEGAGPVNHDVTELVLNRTWRPALAVTGADGLPAIADAGNVARPFTDLRLSLRLPPTCDAHQAGRVLKSILEADPPYGARVNMTLEESAVGWNAPSLAPWLADAMDEASKQYFGAGAVHMGEGGSIPFMGMLGDLFPSAQFMITGVLGPHSNAHGPNEFLHIPTGKKVTACVAHVLAQHYNQ